MRSCMLQLTACVHGKLRICPQARVLCPWPFWQHCQCPRRSLQRLKRCLGLQESLMGTHWSLERREFDCMASMRLRQSSCARTAEGRSMPVVCSIYLTIPASYKQISAVLRFRFSTLQWTCAALAVQGPNMHRTHRGVIDSGVRQTRGGTGSYYCKIGVV